MGPLKGIRVVEMAAIGPAPFCAMMLADMGAEVLRVERVSPADLGLGQDPTTAVLNRNRASLALDLKQPEGIAAVKRLLTRADILIEGYRPGVMERLGLSPAECHAVNPALVYGRVTGWGQNGPLAQTAGHDINFIALTGVLDAIGRRGAPPTPPLNLVGDFGGGGMYLAFGVLCSLIEARRTGIGDVVDAAMVDGASSLASFVHGLHADGQWNGQRGENALDSGLPWYDVYETQDGKWVAIGAIEERFYVELIKRLGLDICHLPSRNDRAQWGRLREQIASAFKTRTREDWCEVMAGGDACFAPVLTFAEAPLHAHSLARNGFIEVDGVTQPAPAPRFTRHQRLGEPSRSSRVLTSAQTLADWGLSEEDQAFILGQRS